MIQPQQNKYLEATLQTATPAQMLVMLCDGAIRFSKFALEAISKKNISDAHHYIGRIQDIISEFIITLDKDSPIAAQLLPLYEYFQHRLTEANIRKEAEPIEEVLGYLADLKQIWAEAARSSQANKQGVTHG